VPSTYNVSLCVLINRYQGRIKLCHFCQGFVEDILVNNQISSSLIMCMHLQFGESNANKTGLDTIKILLVNET